MEKGFVIANYHKSKLINSIYYDTLATTDDVLIKLVNLKYAIRVYYENLEENHVEIMATEFEKHFQDACLKADDGVIQTETPEGYKILRIDWKFDNGVPDFDKTTFDLSPFIYSFTEDEFFEFMRKKFHDYSRDEMADTRGFIYSIKKSKLNNVHLIEWHIPYAWYNKREKIFQVKIEE